VKSNRYKSGAKKDFRRINTRKSQMSGKTNPDKKGKFKVKRKVVVFLAFGAIFTLTTLLLNAMSHGKLPQEADTLLSYDSNESIDSIFRTSDAVQANRWTHIYIHHSKTLAGDAAAMSRNANGPGDHFIIGNGEGMTDGELQPCQRWNHQQTAMAPVENMVLQPGFISICLIGDFDRQPPTPIQWGRLGQLVRALQVKSHIPNDNVVWINDGINRPSSAGGIGKFFPADAFHDQLRVWANGPVSGSIN
jgi:hypothetical protein